MTADGFDLRAYLERIGYAGPTPPTYETLGALQFAHLTSVPFENLDVQLGVPIRLDLASLQAKLVAGRRGGYCFEQNNLFMAALRGIGFEVTPLSARVRFGAKEPTPRTHMLLAVDLDGERWIADVGFGGDCPMGPLRLAEGDPTDLYGWSYRLVREPGGAWVLQAPFQGEWSDLYAFTEEPTPHIDYVLANHYTSTHPASKFVTTLTAQRSGVDERVILRNGDLSVERRDGQVTRTILVDDEAVLEALADRFGLVFPEGTRFRALGDGVPTGFHHVQLAMPSGSEAEADAFYVDLLRFARVPKPVALEARGGRWYRRPGIEVHLGIEDHPRPGEKAHPALVVRGLAALRDRLAAAGVQTSDDVALDGYDRCYVRDPFGNRIELIEPIDR